MLKHDDLSNWFEDLRKIIFDTKISIDNIQRITHPTDDHEKQILKHGFFSHLYRQSRFTIIVQLCKIFDKNSNQKRNFYKLFNRLSSEKFDKTILDILRENGISNYLFRKRGNLDEKDLKLHLFSNRDDIINEIKSLTYEIEIQKEIIEKIIILRDNYYAHFDPDSSLPPVSYDELEVLVNLAIKIYNIMYSRLYDVTLLFDHTTDWKVDYFIKILAKQKKEQIEKRNKN